MSEFGGKKASVGLGLAIALAISTLATMASIFSLGSGNNDYTIKVHFPTANGLIDGSDVFIGGVKVGVVNSVVVDPTPPADSGNSNFANPTSTAMATISIGKQYAPLHQGATAAIRPKSLLGEKYVAMTVGDPGKDAIPDGTTLPPDATSVNVELDQLINVFDEATRKQLQKLIANLGTGLRGQGRNTNETFQVGAQDLNQLWPGDRRPGGPRRRAQAHHRGPHQDHPDAVHRPAAGQLSGPAGAQRHRTQDPDRRGRRRRRVSIG